MIDTCGAGDYPGGAMTDDPSFGPLRDQVLRRELDPWAAADRLLGFD